MKYFLFIITMACLSNPLQAAETGYTTSTSVPVQLLPRQVQVQLEVDEADLKDFGLQKSALLAEIITRLSLGQIQARDEIESPILVLRIKSIEDAKTIAAFVQLAFFEKATLRRNNSIIMAMTWSKAAMLAGAKETFSKEVSDAVISMTNTFVLDYQKALSTVS